MSIHFLAMEHLDKAKAFLERGEDDDLRYAALELRFCIEQLFYRMVPVYSRELPDTVLDGHTWQPGEIIEMLVDIDPYVQKDRVLSIGPEPRPGEAPSQMHVIGRQSGLDKALVRGYYHALGFYLHARTNQKPHDYAKLKRKLTKLLPRLEKFRGDTVLDGFAERVSLQCTECGRPVAKRTEALTRNAYLTCPNRNCCAMFECEETTEAHARLRLLQENLKCTECGVDNFFGVHLLRRGSETGAIIRCTGCGAKRQLRLYVTAIPLETAGPESLEAEVPPPP